LSCVVLAAVIILDLGSASIYRHWKGYSWSARSWQGSKQYRSSSKVYHHDLRPLKAVPKAQWVNGEYSFYTNSLGFRDKSPRRVPLTTDHYRMVFIGDSFTEGLGVDYEATFVGLIDKALSKKGVEVLNAAVVSYSPIIYWKKMQYFIEKKKLKFDELVVFLDISDNQDEACSYYLNKKEYVRMKEKSPMGFIHLEDRRYYLWESFCRFIEDNTILGYLVLYKVFDIESREGQRYTYERAAWTFDDRVYQSYGKKGLGRMKKYMDKLDDLLKKNNIKLTVAVYPWPQQIQYDTVNSRQVTFWEKWCKQHQAQFLNYFPSFLTGQTKQEKEEIIDRYFIKKDVHWNEQGHQKIAEEFLERYSANEFDTSTAKQGEKDLTNF